MTFLVVCLHIVPLEWLLLLLVQARVSCHHVVSQYLCRPLKGSSKFNMGNPTRYNFSKVLVANIELLADSDRSPQVLVLDTKINKCQRDANLIHQLNQTLCSNCCLTSENSEFRRRNLLDPARQLTGDTCFAKCGQRRYIDIELETSAKMSGKLVVLALTQFNPPEALTSSWQMRCSTRFSRHFGRFEPFKANEKSNLTKSHYSRLGSNQIPTVVVSSMSWEFEPQNRRELLKIFMVQTALQRHRRTVFNQEVLLHDQFNCRPHSPASSTREVSGSFHLIMLVNRGLASRSTDDPKALQDGMSERNSTTEHIKEPHSSQSSATTKATSISTSTTANDSSPDRRADFYLSSVSLFNGLAHPSNSSAQRIKTLDKAGPAYSSDTVAGSGFRFTTNELMFVTISWLSVVLLYTLCLLIYMRSATRANPSAKAERRANRKNHDQIHQISGPYNLQMSAATKTRLNMMLRRSPHLGSSQDPNQVAPRSPDGQEEKLKQHWEQPKAYRGSNLAYNTLNAVRAFRYAAAHLTKSKIRYRPNLVAIPEVDNEQPLGSRLSPRLDACKGQVSSMNQPSSLGCETFICDCPHTISDRLSVGLNKQPVRTLFARPMSSADLLADNLNRVSRSSILSRAQSRADFCQ